MPVLCRSVHTWGHYLIYDRWWDRFDTCKTSGALTPQEADIVGEAGHLEQARYQAMARLPLIWALKALDLNSSEFGFVDYGSGRGRHSAGPMTESSFQGT